MSEPFEPIILPKVPIEAVTHAPQDDEPDFFPTVRPELGEIQKPQPKGKHSETPDDDQEHRDGNLSALELLKSISKSFVHSSLESTTKGVGQLINHICDESFVPELRLVNQEEEAKLGTERWFTQTFGSGAGAIGPYLLVDLATRRLGAARFFLPVRLLADEVPGARAILGTQNDHHWVAPWSKAAMDGGIYGSILTPSSDDKRDFWSQREVNGLTTSIAFATQFGVSHGTVSALERFGIGHAHADHAATLDFKTVIGHAGANLFAGSLTGLVSAESYSLMSDGKLASKEMAENAVAKFAFASVVLETMHLGVAHAFHKPSAETVDGHGNENLESVTSPMDVINTKLNDDGGPVQH